MKEHFPKHKSLPSSHILGAE